jgi:hypothetical protein
VGNQEVIMRSVMFALAGGSFLFLGCNSSSQPEASRGTPERRFESSQASELPQGNPPMNLPEGHPPMNLPDGHPPIGAAGGGLAADALASDEGPEVKLGEITFTAPEGWQRKAPQSTFIQAEFALPKAEGDDADGRLTVSSAGGSIEANIERWKGQFTKLENSHQEKFEVAGVAATLVHLSGEFNDQRGPFAPAVSRPDYQMIAAIIPLGEQPFFVKATGPQKTLEAHAEAIKQFVTSAKRGE